MTSASSRTSSSIHISSSSSSSSSSPPPSLPALPEHPFPWFLFPSHLHYCHPPYFPLPSLSPSLSLNTFPSHFVALPSNDPTGEAMISEQMKEWEKKNGNVENKVNTYNDSNVIDSKGHPSHSPLPPPLPPAKHREILSQQKGKRRKNVKGENNNNDNNNNEYDDEEDITHFDTSAASSSSTPSAHSPSSDSSPPSSPSPSPSSLSLSSLLSSYFPINDADALYLGIPPPLVEYYKSYWYRQQADLARFYPFIEINQKNDNKKDKDNHQGDKKYSTPFSTPSDASSSPSSTPTSSSLSQSQLDSESSDLGLFKTRRLVLPPTVLTFLVEMSEMFTLNPQFNQYLQYYWGEGIYGKLRKQKDDPSDLIDHSKFSSIDWWDEEKGDRFSFEKFDALYQELHDRLAEKILSIATEKKSDNPTRSPSKEESEKPKKPSFLSSLPSPSALSPAHYALPDFSPFLSHPTLPLLFSLIQSTLDGDITTSSPPFPHGFYMKVNDINGSDSFHYGYRSRLIKSNLRENYRFMDDNKNRNDQNEYIIYKKSIVKLSQLFNITDIILMIIFSPKIITEMKMMLLFSHYITQHEKERKTKSPSSPSLYDSPFFSPPLITLYLREYIPDFPQRFQYEFDSYVLSSHLSLTVPHSPQVAYSDDIIIHGENIRKGIAEFHEKNPFIAKKIHVALPCYMIHIGIMRNKMYLINVKMVMMRREWVMELPSQVQYQMTQSHNDNLFYPLIHLSNPNTIQSLLPHSPPTLLLRPIPMYSLHTLIPSYYRLYCHVKLQHIGGYLQWLVDHEGIITPFIMLFMVLVVVHMGRIVLGYSHWTPKGTVVHNEL